MSSEAISATSTAAPDRGANTGSNATSDTRFLRRKGAPALAYGVDAPVDVPRAAVLLTHGFAEHRHRYPHVIRRWNERGILVVSYDLRGHGASEGSRGYIERFDEYVDDAVAVLDAVEAEHPVFRNLGPPVAFGHSTGGLITVHLALAHPRRMRSVALSSPFLGLALEVPLYKRVIGNIASRLVPRLSLPSSIKGKDLTHDPEMVASHDADPLIFGHATARWFTETMEAQKRALALAANFSLPLFCLAAGDDRLGKPSASRAFFDQAANPKKTYNLLRDHYHEILNETDRAKTIDDFADAILGAYAAP
jgi:alpha-beta hydrolase superfamily lysophospholipase